MKTAFRHQDRASVLTLLTLLTLVTILVAAVTTAAAARAAEEPTARPPEFSATTTVVAVEVPVRVLRDGRPVRGLTADNFAVFDEGERREIQSFEVLDLEEMAAGETELSPVDVPSAARRHFLLLFDLDFTDGPYLKRAYKAARELVDHGLEPTDLVAVAFFSNRAGVSSVLGFTPDRSQVAAALDQLGRFLGEEEGGGAPAGERAADTLEMTVGGWGAVQADVSAAAQRERSLPEQALEWAGGTGGRFGGAEEVLGPMAAIEAPNVQQKEASRASALVASLRDLAEQYRWIDGQKFLVLFSQSFDANLYLNEGGSWLLREMRGMLDVFRKTGWSIYSIEGVDLNTETVKRKRETLFFLAKQTGGAMVGGRNDLAVSMAKVLMQTSVTYVLGFQAPDLPADGSFRRIRVELRGAPRGTRASYRAGYYVPKPYSELGAAEQRAQSAELLLSGREVDELRAGAFAGPLELTGSGARVPVVLQVDRESLLAGPADQEAGAEIYVYAMTLTGKVAGVLAQRVLVDPEKLEADGTPDGLKFFGELELPPGSYDVRSITRSLRTGWVSVRRLRVEVPASERQRVLLPPLFLQAPQERWLLVRKPREGAPAGEDDYPFRFEGERFLPAAQATVATEGEARLMVMGYGLGGEQIDLESRMLDHVGEVVEGPTLSYLARTDGDESHPEQIVLALHPGGVAPGDYVLELTLSEPDGKQIGSLRTPVRVVPD